MNRSHVVVVGAGHGGASAAATLRQYGFEGAITVIGAEPSLPYQRPPLSKGWLKGHVAHEELLIKPRQAYEQAEITLTLGTNVVGVDRVARTVELDTGKIVQYTDLILATGSAVRRLPVPGADSARVHYLREQSDADSLKQALGPGKRITIIGGGYIGLEVAASAREMGTSVTLVEQNERLLGRVASPEIAAHFRARHEDEGVTFVFGRNVTAIEEGEGSDAVVLLDDGTAVRSDVILVGIGGIANARLAVDAGLECANGITVDSCGRTSDPHIFAIGDATFRPVPVCGLSARLESVPSAVEQSKQVASAITGRQSPKPEIPWFWSHQYDLKLQIAGLTTQADNRVERRTDTGLAVFHLAGRKVLSVEAINSPREYMTARKWITAGEHVDPALLSDPATTLATAVISRDELSA